MISNTDLISETLFQQSVLFNLSLLFWPQDGQQSVGTCKFGLNIWNSFYLQKWGLKPWENSCGKINKNPLFFFKKKTYSGRICKKETTLKAVWGSVNKPVATAAAAENGARWRCWPHIKNVTAHYDNQFCVSFHFCFDWMGFFKT